MAQSSHSKQRLQFVLFQLRTDHTQPSGNICPTVADLQIPGDKVEMEPNAVCGADNALGPQHGTVFPGVQCLQSAANLRLRKGFGCLHTPAGEHLIGMVSVVMVVFMFVVMIMRLMSSIKVYDLIYMLVEESNPALTKAQSLMYLFYRESFITGNRGLGSSVVIWTVAVIGLVTVVQFWGQKKWVNYEV